MRCVNSIVYGTIVVALAPAIGSASAGVLVLQGAQNQVEADVTGGLFTAPVSGQLVPIPNAGLTFLKAFSQTKGPGAAINQTVTTSLTGMANPTFKRLPLFATGTFIPVPKAGGKGYNFVGPPVIMTGGPIIAFRNPQGYGQPKSNINAMGSAQTIVSNTGPYFGASGQFNVGGRKFTAAGAANTMPFGIGPQGTAAASAYDPWSLSPGVYGYAPEIDATVDIAPGEVGGVHIFALDSNSAPDIDSFDQDGEPSSEDLWTLDVTEDGSGNPIVDFELDPSNLADSEIAFELPFLQMVDPTDCDSDSNCEVDDTMSVDAAIGRYEDSLIEAAFVEGAGDDVLSDFVLFGTDSSGNDIATYTPTCAGDGCTVEYGEGVDAGLDVPEPGALAPFGAALAGLAIVRRRGGSLAGR